MAKEKRKRRADDLPDFSVDQLLAVQLWLQQHRDTLLAGQAKCLQAHRVSRVESFLANARYYRDAARGANWIIAQIKLTIRGRRAAEGANGDAAD